MAKRRRASKRTTKKRGVVRRRGSRMMKRNFIVFKHPSVDGGSWQSVKPYKTATEKQALIRAEHRLYPGTTVISMDAFRHSLLEDEALQRTYSR
jgi:hypothetical protein